MQSREIASENELSIVGKFSYVGQMKIFFTYVNAWPYEEFGRKKPNYIRSNALILSYLMVISICCARFALKHRQELGIAELGHCFVFIVITVLIMQRVAMYMTKSYKVLLVKFVREGHLVHFKNRDDYSMQIYNRVETLLKYFTFISHILVAFAIIGFNAMPARNNYVNGAYGSKDPNVTLQLATPLDVFLDTSHLGIGYFVAFFLNIFHATDTAICFLYGDLLTIVLLIHMWGHLKILRHKLETFPKPQMPQQNSRLIEKFIHFNEEENKDIFMLLRECIQHYNFIRKFMGEYMDVFGLSFCMYHLFYLISGCVLLVECTLLDWSQIIQYIPTTLNVTFQLIQLSLVFEIFRSASELTKDAAYDVPWESMNVKNQKILLFFMANLQKSILPNAISVLKVGVETMVLILKTTVSYYMLLRTFKITK